jgi:DNA polymerase I-like protein with 3'-5' exonuclease and polymerase domains
LDATSALIRQMMENSFQINGIKIVVPLDAEAGSGQSWAAAH